MNFMDNIAKCFVKSLVKAFKVFFCVTQEVKQTTLQQILSDSIHRQKKSILSEMVIMVYQETHAHLRILELGIPTCQMLLTLKN